MDQRVPKREQATQQGDSRPEVKTSLEDARDKRGARRRARKALNKKGNKENNPLT